MNASAAFTSRLPARWFAGWTLRARLLAALIALLALICVLVAVVTQLVAHSFLVAQVDGRVHDYSRRAQSQALHMDVSPPGVTGPPSFLGAANAGPGTVAAVFRGSDVVRAGVEGDEPLRLSARETATLKSLPPDSSVHTVSLSGKSYRAVSALDTDGSTVVVALPLDQVNTIMAHLSITELCVTIAGLIAVGLVGETIIRRTLRPLNRVAAVATRVSELELDRGEVALSMRVPQQDTDPRTEIGQVGSSINKMLGHVSNALAVRQASEVRVRKFVADASHELRTPLAAIRGYAELTRRVGGDGVSDDVAYAMRRVESESARMTTLVEDLLLLARLDAGRPLEAAPVDLSMLAIDAISDAHVAGGDHEWSLDLPSDAVVIDGDEPRLRQVLANLLTNARVHTPGGTKVTLALAGLDAGGAVISVVDNGPGIDEALLPDVFERFARGDSSRSRVAGSTGLGLAIVSAVVESHGGSVDVASHPGETAFRVTLPAAPPASDARRPARTSQDRALPAAPTD